MSLGFVIVGTGRSGTKYASELFTRLGIPCGHEALFSTDPGALERLVGDASFGVVPQLAEFDGVVFHQLRHPLAVLRSIMATGFFVDPGPYAAYLELIERVLPEVLSLPSPLRKAMHYIVEWNELAAPYARLSWRVEELSPDVLAEATQRIGIPRSIPECETALREVRRDVNRLETGGLTRPSLGWNGIEECPEKSALLRFAQRLGYHG